MDPKNLLPDIYKLVNDTVPVYLEDEEEFILNIANKYRLPYETAQIVIDLFFEEMRNIILDNKKLSIPSWGTMHISSPISDGNVKMVFPKFILDKKLKKKLNERS